MQGVCVEEEIKEIEVQEIRIKGLSLEIIADISNLSMYV